MESLMISITRLTKNKPPKSKVGRSCDEKHKIFREQKCRNKWLIPTKQLMLFHAAVAEVLMTTSSKPATTALACRIKTPSEKSRKYIYGLWIQPGKTVH